MQSASSQLSEARTDVTGQELEQAEELCFVQLEYEHEVTGDLSNRITIIIRYWFDGWRPNVVNNHI